MADQKEENLSNLAYKSLKSTILSGRMSSNNPLVERTICQQLNISRTPVKHAFQRLQQEGLVQIIPRIGVFPVQLNYIEYYNLLVVREVLEGLSAQLAVDFISNANMREMRAIFDNLGDFIDPERVSHKNYALANVKFHQYILNLSNNPILIRTVQGLYDHMRLVTRRVIELTARRSKSINEHEKIMKAFENRDPEGAGRVMREHIKSLRKDVEIYYKINPDNPYQNSNENEGLGSF